jgi:hypothetical protein
VFNKWPICQGLLLFFTWMCLYLFTQGYHICWSKKEDI